MVEVGIVGASGYSGAELMRLLSARSDVNIATVSAAAKQLPWTKILLAILILVGGGILIAFALREPQPRSAMKFKTETVRSATTEGPSAGSAAMD